MADRVQYVLDKMAPLLKKLEDQNLFKLDEVQKIAKKRTDYEYILRRRQQEPADFYGYLQFELNLEKLLLMRINKTNYENRKDKQDVLRTIHSEFIKHITYIFERGIRRFPKEISLWTDYAKFLKSKNALSILSTVYGRVLSLFPKNEDLWLDAAVYELESNNNAHATRVILQRSLRSNKYSKKLWLYYFEMELWYIMRNNARKSILGLKNDPNISEHLPTIDLLKSPPMIVFKHALKSIPEIQFAFDFYSACIGISEEFSSVIEQRLYSKYKYESEYWVLLSAIKLKHSLKTMHHQSYHSSNDTPNLTAVGSKRSHEDIVYMPSSSGLLSTLTEGLRLSTSILQQAYDTLSSASVSQDENKLDDAEQQQQQPESGHGTVNVVRQKNGWSISLLDTLLSHINLILEHIETQFNGPSSPLQPYHSAANSAREGDWDQFYGVIQNARQFLVVLWEQLGIVASPPLQPLTTATVTQHSSYHETVRSTASCTAGAMLKIPVSWILCAIKLQTLVRVCAWTVGRALPEGEAPWSVDNPLLSLVSVKALLATTTHASSTTAGSSSSKRKSKKSKVTEPVPSPNPVAPEDTEDSNPVISSQKSSSLSTSGLAGITTRTWLENTSHHILQQLQRIGGRFDLTGPLKELCSSWSELAHFLLTTTAKLQLLDNTEHASVNGDDDNDKDDNDDGLLTTRAFHKELSVIEGESLQTELDTMIAMIIRCSKIAIADPLGKDVLRLAIELGLKYIREEVFLENPIEMDSQAGKGNSKISSKSVSGQKNSSSTVAIKDISESIESALLSPFCDSESSSEWCLLYIQIVFEYVSLPPPMKDVTVTDKDARKGQWIAYSDSQIVRMSYAWGRLSGLLDKYPLSFIHLDLTVVFDFILNICTFDLEDVKRTSPFLSTPLTAGKRQISLVDDSERYSKIIPRHVIVESAVGMAEAAVKFCPKEERFWKMLEKIHRSVGDHKTANHILWRRNHQL